MQWIYKNTASSSQRQTLDEGTLQLISGTDLGTNAHTCKTRTTPLHLVVVRQNKCNSFFRHFSFFCPFPLNAKIQKAQLPNFFFSSSSVGTRTFAMKYSREMNQCALNNETHATSRTKNVLKRLGKKKYETREWPDAYIYIYKKDRTFSLNKWGCPMVMMSGFPVNQYYKTTLTTETTLFYRETAGTTLRKEKSIWGEVFARDA